MIVQISLVRNELPLIKELLPIWSKYTDGFVFCVDQNTDDTLSYLDSVKNEYNILEVIERTLEDDELSVETDVRQKLFDTARKYSNKIICLDADEYLDGQMTKDELEALLENSPDTVFHLQWIQYTSVNTVRIDGPWKDNIKDRIGTYIGDCKFSHAQNHSTHLPIPKNQVRIDTPQLFIAHLQWLNKDYVAIKQYYWKVFDYVNAKVHGISVVGNAAYDASVNDFNWEETIFEFPLKVSDMIFDQYDTNYRLDYIREQDTPNLGDWGKHIHDSIPMHFCTGADDKHYPLLVNMIGSIHTHNYLNTENILVYDLGLTDVQRTELSNMWKVRVCDVDRVNPDIVTDLQTSPTRYVKGLFSWKPVIMKQALDTVPYVLYLDAGTTILKPLNDLFLHIVQNGYLLFDCGHSIRWMTTKYLIDKMELSDTLLDTIGIDAGFQGVSRKIYDTYVFPLYELSNDIRNFADDGSCPDGWGCGRHDQTLFSILARQLKLDVETHDTPTTPSYLNVNGTKKEIHLTHVAVHVTEKTAVFRSRWNINYELYKRNAANIRRKYKLSVITAIGPVEKYKQFIPVYFDNIREQFNFSDIEFLIVYSEWTDFFEQYEQFPNIRFIQEDEQLGVYNAWNIGVRNATTEFVTNWNVDDLRFGVNTTMKHQQLYNPEIDMTYSYYTATTYDDYDKLDPNNLNHIEYPDDFHTHVLNCCMAGPDPMWRKSAHTFYGLFDYNNYSIIGDWEMWIRMAANGLKFKLLPYVLCIYIDHPDTVSKSDNSKLDTQKNNLMKQYTIK